MSDPDKEAAMRLCAVSPRQRGQRPTPAPAPWRDQHGLAVPGAAGGDGTRWRQWCDTWAVYELLGSSTVLRAVLERSPRHGTSAATLLGVGRAETGQWTLLETADLVTVAATFTAAEDEMELLGYGPDPSVFAPLRRALANGARSGRCWIGPDPQ